MMTIDDWHKSLLALLIWREAEGESAMGKIAVGWVVRNRAMRYDPPRWTRVMTKHLQFSSLTAPGDKRLVAWPEDNEPAWIESLLAAESVYLGTVDDPTGGAVNYVNLAVADPEWANMMTFKVKIGAHSFYS